MVEIETTSCVVKISTDKELVNAHASVNGDLATEVALEFVLLHGLRGIVRQKLC